MIHAPWRLEGSEIDPRLEPQLLLLTPLYGLFPPLPILRQGEEEEEHLRSGSTEEFGGRRTLLLFPMDERWRKVATSFGCLPHHPLYSRAKARGSHSPPQKVRKGKREGHAWEAGIHDPLSTKIEELIVAVTAPNVFDRKNN
ncbi:hypothetical protein B296_00034859 [Ensete ventricosum]|uniref:Uncharacterized protein n=1 Tax=Ensete ventricosum TaxID=4639 RepID=A0A427A3Y1_ENSVE|nr:hypothetical protein B296_00034859 [Ensete ventricosum]